MKKVFSSQYPVASRQSEGNESGVHIHHLPLTISTLYSTISNLVDSRQSGGNESEGCIRHLPSLLSTLCSIISKELRESKYGDLRRHPHSTWIP